MAKRSSISISLVAGLVMFCIGFLQSPARLLDQRAMASFFASSMEVIITTQSRKKKVSIAAPTYTTHSCGGGSCSPQIASTSVDVSFSSIDRHKTREQKSCFGKLEKNFCKSVCLPEYSHLATAMATITYLLLAWRCPRV